MKAVRAMAMLNNSQRSFQVKKLSLISSFLSNFFSSSTKYLLFSKFTLNAIVEGLYRKNYHHASLVRISYCLPTINLYPVCVLYQPTRNMQCMLAFINVIMFWRANAVLNCQRMAKPTDIKAGQIIKMIESLTN